MRTRAFAGVSLVLLVVGVVLVVLHGDAVLALHDHLDGWGMWGIVALIGIEAVWTLTTIPSQPLMTLAGLLYGVWLGALCILIGGVIGATATFWIGRTWARERVLRWVDKHEGLQKGMKLVEEHPVLSVVIVRTVPVFPLNLLNYGFGVTGVRFRTYVLTWAVVTVPGVAFYSGFGEVLRRSVGGEDLPIWVIGWLIGAAVVMVGLVRYAKKRAAVSD